MTASPPKRRSLRRSLALAFAPLCLVVVAGTFLLLLDAQFVHRDLQRLFEELREVSVSRSLIDELHGFEQWVEAVPTATAATDPLVIADLRHHYDGARATLARFSVPDDPSKPAHDEAEAGVIASIAGSLAELGRRLDSDQAIGGMREPLAASLQAAGVLAATVQAESQSIGDDLDRRSQRIKEFLLLLGLVSAATIAWLGVLLVRRVLRPVRELRDRAAAFGRGERDIAGDVRHRDELGELAETFAAMATQLRLGREELERRVEERSREVLRTARLAELGSLAAGIAHEINNPLASIATCAEGLLREGGESQPLERRHVREYLEIIKKEAQRTRDLTARLLRLARNEHQRRELVWLGTELRETAPMFAHQFANAGVQLVIDADGAGPAILGDAAEWRQVLFNLLRNALDASPRGGEVRVGCRADGERAVLEVADEGPGITETDLDRVFEPFFTTKAPGKGTGLGLAIVHRVVTAHGGSVTAHNRVPRGALFRIDVPVAPPGARTS